MYIPEFWCGVAATILVEVAALIVYVIYFNAKRKNERDHHEV